MSVRPVYQIAEFLLSTIILGLKDQICHKNLAGAIRDDILRRYTGKISQDCEAKFMRYGTATSLCALCGQHLERELKGLFDCAQISLWAESAVAFMQGMCHYKNEDLRNGVKVCDANQLEFFIMDTKIW